MSTISNKGYLKSDLLSKDAQAESEAMELQDVKRESDNPNIYDLTMCRMKHSLEVAREMYAIAHRLNYCEEKARKLFTIGLLHDIGYEFSDNQGHADVGAAMLSSIGVRYDLVEAVQFHGVAAGRIRRGSIGHILNYANMTINSNGEHVTMYDRLKDIESRYGTDSREYMTSKELVKELEMLGPL